MDTRINQYVPASFTHNGTVSEWRRNGVAPSESEWCRPIGVGVVLQTYVQSTLGNYHARLLVPIARTLVPTGPLANFAIENYTSSGHTQSFHSMA